MKIRGHEIIHGTLEIMSPHCAKKRNFLIIERSLNLVDGKSKKIMKLEKNHALISHFIRGYLVISTTLMF